MSGVSTGPLTLSKIFEQKTHTFGVDPDADWTLAHDAGGFKFETQDVLCRLLRSRVGKAEESPVVDW